MTISGPRNQTILVLGGYGCAGKPIVDILLRETQTVNVIIAGRNLSKAQSLVDALANTRATARVVDASMAASLKTAFQGINMVVVASSTNQYTNLIMEAALEAKIDYFDINLTEKARTNTIELLLPRIESSDQCFVIEGGYHPGIPAALVKYAALRCPTLHSADIYTFVNPDWNRIEFTPDTRQEFVQELLEMDNRIYQNGQWTPQGWSVYREYDFGGEYGTQTCVPMFMEELKVLPIEIPSLQETGMYIAGFNFVTNMVVMPFMMLWAYLFPNRGKQMLGRLFQWSVCRFARPPFGAVMTLEARGGGGGEGEIAEQISVRLVHRDAYVFTAIPAVACLLQLLDSEDSDGKKKWKGLHRQGNIVEPNRFISDMERMGIEVSISTVPVSMENGKET